MATPEPLYVFVEIPKGSRNKYEYDPEVGHVVLDRTLWTSVVYPADYGFIVDTIGRDGDPVDALVLVAEPTFPGCVIKAKPIALFRMSDEKGPDDKVLFVPCKDPNWNIYDELEELPEQLREEIAHFFGMYKGPEGKVVVVDGWYPLEEALDEIERSRERWRERESQREQ